MSHLLANGLTTMVNGTDLPCTIAMQWTFTPMGAGAETFWCFGDTAGNSHFRFLANGSGLFVSRRGTTGAAIQTSPAIPQDAVLDRGKFEHITIVRFNGTTIDVFHDSGTSPIISGFAMDTPDLSCDRFALGIAFLASGTPTQPGGFYMRRFAAWDSALTTEIATLYDGWLNK